MKLCFLADARSPIARNWISYFIERGHEVHVISSYPCSPDSLPVASLQEVPLAFSGLVGLHNSVGIPPSSNKKWSLYHILSLMRNGASFDIAMAIRRWIAPVEIHCRIAYVRKLMEEIGPDLVHAMRIPFEGILAALAVREIPLLISSWGNDFTLHAKHYPIISALTRRAMRRTDALHCDCFRDLHLASRCGFDDSKPSIVLPGAGGVRLSTFHPGPADITALRLAGISPSIPVVINPRGFRGYVRNDTFFRAIPLVLQKRADVVFLCSATQNNPLAEQWIRRLNIGHAVRLLPSVPHDQMADFFRLAQVTVSPSEHDGTPNTLLEAMACGCFPVAGDIESVREWIQDGVNGLLCDPASPESVAQAILRALNDPELRERARQYNVKLIAERAEYGKVMAQAEQFYCQVIEHARSKRKHS